MADDPTPHWQPLTALPLIASLIDGELADAQEHHATLLSVRDRPHVLDDATFDKAWNCYTYALIGAHLRIEEHELAPVLENSK